MASNQSVESLVFEEEFKDWARPPGQTEKNRCENAKSVIRNAINASHKLKLRDISIFVQGSYRNNTNVRKESDVDIGILCKDTFFYHLPKGTTEKDVGIFPASYHYNQFKNEVEEALIAYLGTHAISRGNKAFDIHETSYHVDADASAFFEHRRYESNGNYISGVELLSDKDNKIIINWPEQHYDNGVEKNKSTGMRYKSIVRILKTLSLEMAEEGINAAKIPGFLIECLVWNVPDNNFQNSTLTADLKAALIFLYNSTKTESACQEWGEVSDLKYLINPAQKWTREQANAFLLAVWNYLGFGKDR